jgi:NADPH-dependent 2,4-dienoyl-CoA reductase/sulfur reductase-like enzyme/nitrite reductase/ring-hydroxylating ferredoxin subunit
MADEHDAPTGPDLTAGIADADLADGAMLAGHVGKDAVLLARRGGEVFAVSARCSHYHGPLAEGILDGDHVRCPWHHACFSLRTGEALAAPAFAPLDCWTVEQRDGRIVVTGKQTAKPKPRLKVSDAAPRRIVIVGGGGAGFAAAEMLRRQEFTGEIVILSSDSTPPVDRPNLSKDYLAGTAPEQWVPLRSEAFYKKKGIDLRLGTEVVSLDPRKKEVALSDGTTLGYDRLLLATGAAPVRLPVPGGDQPHVHVLRSLADSRAIIAAATGAKRAVVIGASFIGLEVAASLVARKLDVHVVAPEARPMERVLGPQLGDFIRALHEEKGVVFHLGQKVEAIAGKQVRFAGGGGVEGEVIVAGVGVRPRLALAEQAGLAIDKGVVVNGLLEAAPGIYAAGDIARWPDPHSGQSIRVEHWVVAERQGQAAALNMLGAATPFDAVPFFWSQHYDVPINYVGHAEAWDEIAIDGDIAGRDCVVRYKQQGRTLAVASIYRDVDSLKAEVAMERQRV